MAMTRTIFPDLLLFKKDVRERALVTLREIFRIHPVYKFDDDMNKTQIHIQPTYADLKEKSKNPRLLLKVGEYALGLQDTLGKNMSGEIRNDAGVIAGYTYQKHMTTVLSIGVKAYAEEESSDIADEIAALAVYGATHMFSQMKLIVEGATVSETVEVDAANDVYQTTVLIRLTVPWEFKDISDKAALEPGTDIEYPDIDRTEYRAPGAYVYNMGKLTDSE